MAAGNRQALENQKYGDLQYNRGGLFWDVLHPGTSGQVLQTQGRDKPPKWGTAKLCYDAIVDPAGTGTHTTIQAALTAVKDTANARILIFGGTYTEALVPSASGSSTHITLEACPPEWNKVWTLTGLPTIGVTIAPSAGIAFDLNLTGSIKFDLLGIGITGVNGQPAIRMNTTARLTLDGCSVVSSSTTDEAIHIVNSSAGAGFIEILRSYVSGQATNTSCIGNITSSAPDIFCRESTLIGYHDLNNGGASGNMTAVDCLFNGNGAAQIISLSTGYFDGCTFNCGPSTATGALTLNKVSTADRYFIHNCQFNSLTGFSSGTAIALTSGAGAYYGTIGGNYFNLAGGGIAWNIGVSVGANCHPIIFANQFTTTVTPVSGTPDAIYPGESSVASVSLHNILSATHSDSNPGAVVAGDVLYGNSTPKWDRLPKGSNGQVLTMAAGLPAWAAAPSVVTYYIPFGSEAAIGEAYTP